jgi:hypothetical protein
MKWRTCCAASADPASPTAERRELDVFDGLPRARADRAADELGL